MTAPSPCSVHQRAASKFRGNIFRQVISTLVLLSMGQPWVLILGHSFIRRLRDFIVKNAPDYHLNLNLTDSVTVQLHDVGGRTIAEVRQFDLGEVIRFRPDIVFLQIGTNDLVERGMSPLTVGSATEDFVRRLHDEHDGVRLICEGQTIRRHLGGNFNDSVRLLAQYLKTVLEQLPFAIYWTQRGFWRSSSSYLSYDGVHLNREGQHKLF